MEYICPICGGKVPLQLKSDIAIVGPHSATVGGDRCGGEGMQAVQRTVNLRPVRRGGQEAATVGDSRNSLDLEDERRFFNRILEQYGIDPVTVTVDARRGCLDVKVDDFLVADVNEAVATAQLRGLKVEVKVNQTNEASAA
ncbi:hypothetical protein COT78_03105 [Candidatus Berkelbacteria bacterium CG10_big_fil_rev_8_21_14_0_10_43_13]|uniref:Uncharacterized protein n=1 Tax=Candidatus Berkelbacteria bacterium CG10_big_fil_rev_8_21_14_0_10_43_13 TaxID=1974514 RepID=A0A2H0W5Z0_9BACT|nr:hypothetical protein [bacterium]PIS07496.1 MAG: hypothetical protein COT78_03105 [Candidatus Berkelbacteria bacterium CG10_big_fil_rev_8_21_14_0_10_43_13]